MAEEQSDKLTLEGQSTETVEEQPTETPVQEPPTEPAQVPEKFQGKEFDDVVKAYQELEKEKGRISTELGREREFTRNLQESQLQTNLNNFPSTPPTAVETPPHDSNMDSMFWEKPTYVVRKLIEESEQKRVGMDVQRQEMESQRMRQVEQAEIKAIQAEDPSYSINRYYMMEQLVKDEPTLVAGMNPREAIRKLHDVAKERELKAKTEELRALGIDPEVLKQVRNLQTNAASKPGIGNGTAQTRNGTDKVVELSAKEKRVAGLLGIPEDKLY